MQVVVELWKARPGWLQRPLAERASYLESVAPAIRQLLADGCELVAIGQAGQPNSHYDYWAIWKFPDQDHLLDFTDAIESVGWHEHFERVKVGVEARPIEELLPPPIPPG